MKLTRTNEIFDKLILLCYSSIRRKELMKLKDKNLQKFWETNGKERPKEIPADLAKATLKKLQMIEAAKELKDLKIPPGNNLEKLTGKRKGQYSIRVNDKYRLCLTWNEISKEAEGVEFVDYHN